MTKRRGRPAANPETGPMSDRERSSLKRTRQKRENVALVGRLRFAMLDLRKNGLLQTVGWMFWGDTGEAALRACTRHAPKWLVDDIVAMAEEARAEATAIAGVHHDLDLPEPAKGRLAINGKVYQIRTDGAVLCGDEPTGFYINREYNCWVLARPKDAGFRLRRHYVSRGGRATALKDAALLHQRAE